MTSQATKNETRGMTVTDETYAVCYSDHDRSESKGVMFREGLDSAERSAKLLGECGYQHVEVRHAASMLDL